MSDDPAAQRGTARPQQAPAAPSLSADPPAPDATDERPDTHREGGYRNDPAARDPPLGGVPPRMGRVGAQVSFMFPAVARLELDELLEQLIGRAEDVLRTQGRLRGLLHATQAISADLDLTALLSRIVEQARTLIGARYAALGVIGTDGLLSEFVHSGMDPATVSGMGHLPTGRGLLGQLVNDPRPLRLAHLGDHDSSSGFPDAHPPMGSFLGVPVRIRGQVFGNLYLTEKTGGGDPATGSGPGQFTAEDEELALSLAAAAAAAIENARLFTAAGRRERWLAAAKTVTNALLEATGRDEALRRVAEAVRTAADADYAAVLVQAPEGPFVVAAADGPGAVVTVGALTSVSSPGMDMLRRQEPVLVTDLVGRTDLQGPVIDLGMGSAAAVPLVEDGQVLGSLVVARLPHHPPLGGADLDELGEFAAQAALVLHVLSVQQAAKEAEMGEERARIARDLHDHAIQSIFSAGLSLNGVAARARPQDRLGINDVVSALDEAITAIRRSIFTLERPSNPDAPGVRARVSALVEEATRVLGFPPLLRFEGPVDSMVGDQIAHDLYAVLRESLSNIARHAHASRVEILVASSDTLTLRVTDNGAGIGSPARSSGLRNMRERADRHGGTFTIGVVLEGTGGTALTWIVPLRH